jgi:hypothetical protein
MKQILVGVAATALLAFSAIPAIAGQQDFALVNATGYTIDKLYVAPSSSDSWEEDVLGRDQLANGESTNITFSRSESTCKWDIKVVYDDGEAVQWHNANLCNISKITLHYNKSSGDTSASAE